MSASAPIPSPDYDPSSEGLDPTSEPRQRLVKILTILTIPVILLLFFAAVQVSKEEDVPKLLQVVVALVLGVIGVWGLFWAMDRSTNLLSKDRARRLRPWIFAGPAILALTVYLVYPAVNTAWISLFNNTGETFVGLDNYVTIFTESQYQIGIRNSILWVLVVPALSVAVGLIYAVMADRLNRRAETTAKSLIFLPMAISFVGASVVWFFMYAFRPAAFGNQIGFFNGIIVALGGEPVNWLNQEPWNNAMLMFILVWLQTGFAMVILSSAIKGVPAELQEASRIDGATEWQTFRNITVPIISSTIVVVWTTVAITTWKVFDIVWVMTGGRNGTQVVAQQMVQEFFTFFRDGIGAALAVVLFIAVIPILVVNIRRFQAQEEMR